MELVDRFFSIKFLPTCVVSVEPQILIKWKYLFLNIALKKKGNF